MTVNVNFPTTDNYQYWQEWGKALVRQLLVIMSYSQIIPDVSSVVSFPNGVVPPGYVKCNGQPFDKNGYPVLYSLLGTTTLPNLNSPYGVGYTVWMKAA